MPEKKGETRLAVVLFGFLPEMRLECSLLKGWVVFPQNQSFPKHVPCNYAISGAQWEKNGFCGQIYLGNNAYYAAFFRKCSVGFNPVFLKHLTEVLCLFFLSNGIHLGKLLLCDEAESQHSRLWVGREDGSFGSL